jgi:hypothetical protein
VFHKCFALVFRRSNRIGFIRKHNSARADRLRMRVADPNRHVTGALVRIQPRPAYQMTGCRCSIRPAVAALHLSVDGKFIRQLRRRTETDPTNRSNSAPAPGAVLVAITNARVCVSSMGTRALPPILSPSTPGGVNE